MLSLVEIDPSVFRYFLKILSMYFRVFLLSSPLGKTYKPSFGQTWIPFTQGCFVPSLVEIGPMVLKKKIFLISSMHFRYFVIIPLGKWRGPSFEQTWIPFTQGCFVPSLVEIGPVVLDKKMKMWKVYDNDNNNDRQQTNFDQKYSLEPSAQVR